MGEFSAFFTYKESIKNFYNLISNVTFSFKENVEEFHPAFNKCTSDAENHFGRCSNKHASLLLGFGLANHVLDFLSGGYLEKDSVVQFKYSSPDLSNKEKLAVFT